MTQMYDIAGAQSKPNQKQKHRSIRSEEHTSELQSQSNLVCRLLLEKKKNEINRNPNHSSLSGSIFVVRHPTICIEIKDTRPLVSIAIPALIPRYTRRVCRNIVDVT